jgi:hypothetical protein
MSSSKDLMLWQESRQERRLRERRERRKFWGRIAGCSTAVIFATLGVAVYVNQPPGSASASEIEATTTTLPLAPEFRPDAPVPEAVATSVPPEWIRPRVTIPGWDGLGKLITDGEHYKTRVLPGELGVSVIGVEGDLSTAATIVVEGISYRVSFRGTVPSNNLDKVANRTPIKPVVVLVSLQPGDARPYVEATP